MLKFGLCLVSLSVSLNLFSFTDKDFSRADLRALNKKLAQVLDDPIEVDELCAWYLVKRVRPCLAKCTKGQTLLGQAIVNNCSSQTISLLLRYGANPDQLSKGIAPLILARFHREQEVVTAELIHYGARVKEACPYSPGDSRRVFLTSIFTITDDDIVDFIHRQACELRWKQLENYVEFQELPNWREIINSRKIDFGLSALHRALINGAPPTLIHLFLLKGADPNLPLRKEIFQRGLLNQNLLPGFTAAHIAICTNASEELINLLKSFSCDFHRKHNFKGGVSARDLAVRSKRKANIWKL